MQRPMPDAKQPDIDRVGLLRPKALRGIAQLASDGPAPGVHVDGDVLAVVVGLDLGTNVAFVYLVAEAGGLLSGPTGHHLGLLRYGVTPRR